MNCDQKKNEISKRIVIAQAVINQAFRMVAALNSLPKSKTKRNIFIKSYNRRPMNKPRTRTICNMIYRSTLKTYLDIRMITDQPVLPRIITDFKITEVSVMPDGSHVIGGYYKK